MNKFQHPMATTLTRLGLEEIRLSSLSTITKRWMQNHLYRAEILMRQWCWMVASLLYQEPHQLITLIINRIEPHQPITLHYVTLDTAWNYINANNKNWCDAPFQLMELMWSECLISWPIPQIASTGSCARRDCCWICYASIYSKTLVTCTKWSFTPIYFNPSSVSGPILSVPNYWYRQPFSLY